MQFLKDYLYRFFNPEIETTSTFDVFDIDFLKARKIVFSKNIDGAEGISKDSDKHIHAYILGVDSLSLSIAKQLALLCHFPNFDDRKGANRTIITIVTTGSAIDAMNQFRAMTANLLDYVLWRCVENGNEVKKCNRQHSFIDIEFEFIKADVANILKLKKDDCNSVSSIFYSDDTPLEREVVRKFDVIYRYNSEEITIDKSIDISRAMLVNTVYSKCGNIDTIYKANAFNAESYSEYLENTCRYVRTTKIKEFWDGIATNELKLSNVFCADTFRMKLRSVGAQPDDNINTISSHIGENLEALSYLEHARWNVEKLILGFRPLNEQEWGQYTSKSKDEKKVYAKKLKAQKIHLNICSISELKRIDPGNFKYDCLLCLSIPHIISRAKRLNP